MKKTIFGALLVVTALFLTACGKIPTLENGEEVLASVEGLEVTAKDVYNELKKKYGANVLINIIDQFIIDKEIEDQSESTKTAKDQIASLKLQYEQAGMNFLTALNQAGFATEEEYLKTLTLDVLREELAKKHIGDNLSDDEINKYYESDIFGELTVRHILITPNSTDSSTTEEKTKAEEEALKKAKEIITKLEAGESFEELAKENSDDGTASQGGLFSNFTKQQVVSEFWDASYKLKNEEYTKEPVKTKYGYHVILKVSAKDKPSLKDVKNTIIDTLVSNKMNADSNLVGKTFEEIRKKYGFEIIDTDVDRAYKAMISNLYANTN